MPNLSAKVLRKCEPMTKTDEEGRLLLVGYKRKGNSTRAGGSSKKGGRTYWLKTPKVLSEAQEQVQKSELPNE